MYACLDDRFYDSPAFADATNECLGVWAKGLAYCNRHLTDGYIPERVARGFAERVPNTTLEQSDSEALLREMVRCGLWKRLNGGFSHVGYLDHNPSKATVLAMRENAKARKAKWKGNHTGTRSEHDPGTVPNITQPNITQPNTYGAAGAADGESTKVVSKKRGTRLPDDWAPPIGKDGDSWREIASQRGFTDSDVAAVLAEFKDYWKAATGQQSVKLDWTAAWRNRLRDVRRPGVGAGYSKPGNGVKQLPAASGGDGWKPGLVVNK